MWQQIEFTKAIEKRFSFLKHVPLLPNLLDEQLKVLILFLRPAVFSKMIDYTKFVKALKGVHTSYHRYGGLEFRVQGKEIGHLHGDGLVDLRFSVRIRQALVGKGLADPHHVLDVSGWVSYSIRAGRPIAEAQQLTQWAVNWATYRDEKALLEAVSSWETRDAAR